MRRTRATPGPTDSLSSNDVHSKAKCILHSVGLALQGRKGLSTTKASASTPPAGLPPVLGLWGQQALSWLYLGQLDGLTELVQGALEVCDLWGQRGEPGPSLLGVSSFCPPMSPAWPSHDPLEGQIAGCQPAPLQGVCYASSGPKD